MTSMERNRRIPSDYCITIQGVNYAVPWDEMDIGHSVFIKTAATAGQVQREATAAGKRFNIKLVARARHEFGYYGVRIWRIS